jgi:hypothetical protein
MPRSLLVAAALGLIALTPGRARKALCGDEVLKRAFMEGCSRTMSKSFCECGWREVSSRFNCSQIADGGVDEDEVKRAARACGAK